MRVAAAMQDYAHAQDDDENAAGKWMGTTKSEPGHCVALVCDFVTRSVNSGGSVN